MRRYERGASAPVEMEATSLEELRQRRYRKAMVLKDELHLSDDERYELARMIPSVDRDGDGSWKALNPQQLHDLITMMEGYAYISFLVSQRT